MERIGRFTSAEELANAISHGIGAALGLAGLVSLVRLATLGGSLWHVVSASVFGATLLLLYLSSTLNHSLPHGKSKDFFHNFDQVAIYLLIAGTYTPFALIALNGTVGWLLFGAEWGIAAAGIVAKFLAPNKYDRGVGKLVVASYVLMGWMLLLVIKPILAAVPFMGLGWLFLGGFMYTGGIVFFRMTRLPYHHLIWHLFVIGGSICHFIAIYWYVMPLRV